MPVTSTSPTTVKTRPRPTTGATPTTSSPRSLTRLRRLPKVMDDLGYDTLWLAEHHFQHEGYECLPNILMLAVHLAHITKQLRIGCGFNIAPMWHPLRLAEDYATADILTKGRPCSASAAGTTAAKWKRLARLSSTRRLTANCS